MTRGFYLRNRFRNPVSILLKTNRDCGNVKELTTCFTMQAELKPKNIFSKLLSLQPIHCLHNQ